MNKKISIVLAGEAGQGIQSIETLLVHFYCKCNGADCDGISNFVIKDAVHSLDHVHVYSDFNCYAEDIKTGEVKPLLDKLRNDVANDPSIYWVAFEIYGGSTFETPAVFEDKVVLSFLKGDLLPYTDIFTTSYLLLVDINNPDDYKLIPINNSPFYVKPLFNGEYIITGDLTIYNILTGETKKITVTFQTNQNRLNLFSLPTLPSYFFFFSEYYQPYSISGEKLVFRNFESKSSKAGEHWEVYDIYLYNIKESKEVKIYSNTIDSTSLHPAIWGDKVVWMQSKKIKTELGTNLAETSIMLYNLTTGELREIVPEKPNPLWPTTNGRYIAWLDTEVGDEGKGRAPDVYLYDIETRETWKVSPD